VTPHRDNALKRAMNHEKNQVFIRDLEVVAVIGVYEQERTAPRSLLLDLDIALPDAASCQSDCLEDTIDYAQVVERIREALAIEQFALVEAAAEHLAQLLLHEFGVPWVRVSVAKAGMISGVRLVGAKVERTAVPPPDIHPEPIAAGTVRSRPLAPV